MEKARFIQFRSDLFKLCNQIKGYHPHIVGHFNQLGEAYPEFNASYAFPDEVTEQLQTAKKKRKPKDLEEIESRLRESLKTQRFMDYASIQLKLDNEQTCMEILKELDKAEEDTKKRVVYFSCLKG